MKLNKNFYLIRVVDDDEEFLDAVEFILSTDDWKSQSFQSSEDFLRQEESNINAPGCLILDFFMPIKNGLEVQAELKKINPDLPIIFLTGHGELDIAIKAFKNGACDFLQKPVNQKELFAAVENAIKKYDANLDVKIQNSKRHLFNSLTDREKQVFYKLVDLLSAKEISESLGISERTAEGHRSSVMRKLGLRKIRDAITFNQAMKAEDLLPF